MSAHDRSVDNDERFADALAEEERLERANARVWGRKHNPECVKGGFCPHGCGWCREAMS